MATATRTKPRPSLALAHRRARPAATAGDRVLDAEETGLARIALERLDDARETCHVLFGRWQPTEEWLEARERFDEWDDDEDYQVAALDDVDLLSPDELVSYARFAALVVSGPNSIDRFAWSMLRSAEVDVVRCVLALNDPADPTQPRANWIVVDGRRFSYRWLDDDRNPVEARLIETS